MEYDAFFLRRNRYFQKKFLRNFQPPKVFIGFDNGSDLVFEKWKGKSVLILDLTIAIPQFKKELAKKYNLSKKTIENLTRLDEIWYESYEKELKLADYILCGSEFVKKSCQYFGIEDAKLMVLPYGANLTKFTSQIQPEARKDIPLKIAFVGNVSYRKGADILLKAWENMADLHSNVELHFYGNVQIDIEKYNLKNVFFHGFILQDDLIQRLNESHISILPTFFEGSSYAIYQSMALGLAVITTMNCGSIIKHMENGIIIDYGSEAQIIDALSTLINKKELRLKLSRQAIEYVKEYSWENYGIKLKDFIYTIM
jgi:glycosyltransferase involved in cell wall biosynthesis